MARLFSVFVDCQDHIAQARWWADVFRRPVAGEREDEAWLELDTIRIEFVPVSEPKEGKNRARDRRRSAGGRRLDRALRS